ncbi:profilin-2-like [Sinocyclocheilus grahami]|uniref:profilin-2-like n=1 Tax=Sinocyclocheilus grahami TaxID=75366 RepID=UPI0007AD0F91|nr:PREDICTED: profilin-2-like [Sinocyclocheilus grahami]
MSWDSYISSLTKSEWVDDAVILGCTAGQESVWASAPGGWLNQVTASEVQAMIASDRSGLFSNGVTVAGKKCTVLRDALNVDGQNTMDIKMKTSEKEPDPFSFTIGRSHKGEYMSNIKIWAIIEKPPDLYLCRCSDLACSYCYFRHPIKTVK